MEHPGFVGIMADTAQSDLARFDVNEDENVVARETLVLQHLRSAEVGRGDALVSPLRIAPGDAKDRFAVFLWNEQRLGLFALASVSVVFFCLSVFCTSPEQYPA
jgi:hypothetical protein